MTLRIAALPCEDRDIFKARESTEGHLAKDAQTEEGEWGRYQTERVVLLERTMPAIDERNCDQEGKRQQKNYGTDIVDPFADAEPEGSDAHRQGNDDERCPNDK